MIETEPETGYVPTGGIMGSTPQNERDANRFAGKINVPGSPVMLKYWRKPSQLVRTDTGEPPDDYDVDGELHPGDVYSKRVSHQGRKGGR